MYNIKGKLITILLCFVCFNYAYAFSNAEYLRYKKAQRKGFKIVLMKKSKKMVIRKKLSKPLFRKLKKVTSKGFSLLLYKRNKYYKIKGNRIVRYKKSSSKKSRKISSLDDMVKPKRRREESREMKDTSMTKSSKKGFDFSSFDLGLRKYTMHFVDWYIPFFAWTPRYTIMSNLDLKFHLSFSTVKEYSETEAKLTYRIQGFLAYTVSRFFAQVAYGVENSDAYTKLTLDAKSMITAISYGFGFILSTKKKGFRFDNVYFNYTSLNTYFSDTSIDIGIGLRF